MGYSFDLTTPGGSSTGLPKKSVPMRAAPVQSTWSQPETPASSFGRIDLTGAAVTGIQMAATAPGYIYERPLAALNTIGKSKPEDKGLIDQAGDTIRSIPVLGDLLSGGAQAVGNTIEGSGRIFPALANSWMASALADNYGKGDDEKVDGLPAWFATSRGLDGNLTVGELRQIAAQRGFTAEDAAAVKTGQRSIYDWADKSISDNPLVDLGGRMVVDPLNLVAFGAAGAAAKGVVKGVSLGGKIFDGTTMMSRIDKLATGAKALEDAVGLSRTGFKSTIAGMRALQAGEISGVTLNTLGRHLAMFSRGSSDFLRAYRKVAIGTTAAQIGLQELGKSGITDNTPLSPIMDSLYEAADRMAEDKPLSEGMLFNLWAAVNFPIRDGLSDAWHATSANGVKIGPVQTSLLRRITDIEKYVVKELAPGKSFKEGREYLIGRFGSEDRFQDHIMHFTRSLVTEDPNTAMPALTNQPATTAEFQATAEANNRVWDAATRARVESGEIDGRAVFEHMRDKYRGTRSTSTNRTGGETEVTGRVARDWDPEDHIRQWNDWADRMEALNLKAGFQKGGNLVIGIMDGLMPKEHLVAAKRTLEAIAGPDGIIPKNRMDEFLNAFPALDADVNDPGNFFARLRAADSRQVHYKEAVQRIDKLMKDPRTMTMREYLYGVEQMQKRAESIKTRRGTVLDENGMPDPTRAPDIGQAAVLTPTLKDSVRRQMGLDGLTLEDVHASRGDSRTRSIEDDVAAVIDESGFNLRAAVQGIVSRGGKKVTALSLHLDSKTDVGSLELAGAIALRRTGADRATILYSGAESLTTHGLTANAAHTRFDIGRAMNEGDIKARVLDAAVEAFDGQFELNDTAGVLHVVVKPGQEEAIQALTDLIDGVVGRDRVSVSHEPAWFQVIRNDMRSGGRGRATAGESSARAIWDAARGDLRLVNSERKFSERAIRSAEYATATSKGARDSRGVLGKARTGFTRGPESARAGRDGLGADLEGGVTRDPIIEAHDVTGSQGQVVFLAEADDALEALTPRLTADLGGEGRTDLGGLDPVQIEKIKGLETELRQYDPQYRIKIAPTQGNVATYYPGQGNAIKDLMATSRAASDLLTFKRWSKAAAFWDLMFRPVQTSKLGDEAKQALYRELLGRTAHLPDDKTIRIKDIDSFLQTANAAARQNRILGAQTYARGELLDIKTLTAIADGSFAKDLTNNTGGIFQGFTPEALAAIGGAKHIHKILDRTGSRFFRDLEKRMESKGGLGEAITATYGGVRSKTATPRHYIRTWYHLFRFTFDPRFHVMNHAEADMLGLMKYGWGTTRMGGARKAGVGKDGATQAHSRGGDMNADRMADALASGVLDARHLEGYIGRGFQVDRVRSTREVLRTIADEDPAAKALRNQFGGTVDEWVDGLEETMYSFDTKGVDETITEAMAGILDEADRVAMEPLLIRLYERNRQIFRDVKSTFHGNTNRSNIERIMNSYFLYWPISYQLKAGKWLFDVLTKQSLGRKTNLGGAWYVNNLYQQHMERMARDETYQRTFTDNPALWFTASMLLPMTPWDMSVGMSRATRYMLAGVGIIEEPKFEEDPFMAAMRLAHIGPAYTIELAERMYRESKDRPRDLVVPVN